MLDKEYLVSEYNYSKRKALENYYANKIAKCLDFAEYCALIAWYYPILFNYVDDELEELLGKAASSIIGEQYTNNPGGENANRIVFYAGQIIDSGALTEQYLNFFIENKFEILLVIPDIKNTVYGKRSLKILQAHSNVTVFIDSSKSKLRKIQNIYKQTQRFNPSKAFLHFLPNDVVGYCVFSKIISIKKYYIVHNDHTFWLGKNCSDYFLEFRKFGYLLSIERRNIPREKILLLPYYPINNSISFKGFPFDRSNKIVGISGAILYKYLMDPELKYFHAIKQLLKQNENFIFCLCGAGEYDIIAKIFEDDGIKERFYYLGKRDDFYSLIGHCDILFESYPLKGGLTVLFATEQKKAIVGIGNNKNASGCIQDWFDLKDYEEPLTIEDFICEADLLIKDSRYRAEKALKFSINKFNKSDFERGLKLIISGKNKKERYFSGELLKLNDEYFLNEYLFPFSESLFLKTKLFSLKRNLRLKQRLIIFKYIYQHKKNDLNAKELFRLLLIVIIGG